MKNILFEHEQCVLQRANEMRPNGLKTYESSKLPS